jgi:hypothetical protein
MTYTLRCLQHLTTPADGGTRLLQSLYLMMMKVAELELATALAGLTHLQDLSLECICGPDGGFLATAPPTLRSLHMEGLPDFKGPMMLNVRRLTRLTSLMIVGFPNLVGDAPIAALAPNLPPDLAVLELELSWDYQNEDQVSNGRLSDDVLELLGSPLLGPCRVQQLSLNDQHKITGRGIAARAGGRFPVLERLILDGTDADDEALPLLAPLAGTLEFVSVVCPFDDEHTKITWEGVQVAMEAFARCGGKPEIHYTF